MGLDIRYARSGGVSIAYQVVGDGDVDLVYVPDYISNSAVFATSASRCAPACTPAIASCTSARSPGSPS